MTHNIMSISASCCVTTASSSHTLTNLDILKLFYQYLSPLYLSHISISNNDPGGVSIDFLQACVCPCPAFPQ